ncbi:MAG: nuclease A inhibitor family protein [Cyanobacteria bacterium J06632_22]
MDATPSNCPLIQQLQSLTEGLLWPSEADYPIDVIHWLGADAPLTVPEVLTQGNHAADARVETIPLSELFRNVVRLQDWFGEAEVAQAQQFQQVLQLLGALSHPQGYRVGEVEVTVYGLGQLPDGAVLGIRTQVVET